MSGGRGNKPQRCGDEFTRLFGTLVMSWYSSQLPTLKGRGAVPSSPIPIQVIVFGEIRWACKLTCSKPRPARPWVQGGEIPPAPGSLRSAAEQRCPGAARGWLAARAVLSRCFLLMQQKAFPSSLYPSNRQDPIRLMMRQNKNTRHKAEAQMLAFMVSFIPSVAQGFMASQNFPQHIFLAVPI